jgi:ribonuclease T2
MRVLLAFSLMLAGPALGQEARGAPPGRFDFYVLALSWSPTHCADPENRMRDALQCAGPRPFSFIVHGLWPQYERGYPRLCPTRERGPDQKTVRAVLDLMPDRDLVWKQWERHGACSGLSAPAYFAQVRAARAAVTIPMAFVSPQGWRTVTAGEVERAFRAANPGLGADSIAVEGRRRNLGEVRICLTRDLARFRPCPQVDEGGLPAQARVAVPPARGG